jgi:hypothetical protein
MTSWPRVKWSEAGQIAAILGWKEPEATARLPPADYFARLKSEARYGDAVKFMAQALPRLETVAWAARAVRDIEPAAAPDSAEASALKSALLWLQDPVEGRRRAAFDAAQAADSASPEAMAAMAVFYSGGSIAPENCEPLPAPREAAGRFSAGAILLAAARNADMNEALRKLLSQGEALAMRGLNETAAP